MKRYKHKSFTLLELILVVLILGVLIGVSVPYLKKNSETALFRTLAKRVSLLLDYAQKQAIIKNTIKTIHINLNEKTIGFPKQEGQKQEIPDIKIPDNINLETNKEDIALFPNGTLENFKLILNNNKGFTINIFSNGVDGKIKQDEKKEEY